MNTHRAFWISVMMWAGWGCSDVLGPSDGSLAIQTDQSSYQLTYLGGDGTYRQYGFELVATYTNHTKKIVYLGRCYPDSDGPIYTVRGVGFDSAYSGVWACVGHDRQFRIEPGESRTDTLHITGPSRWSAGVPYGEMAGVFELVYPVAHCSGDGGCTEPAPREIGLSNPFEVEGP